MNCPFKDAMDGADDTSRTRIGIGYMISSAHLGFMPRFVVTQICFPFYATIAQLVESLISNQNVVGSSPTGRSKVLHYVGPVPCRLVRC